VIFEPRLSASQLAKLWGCSRQHIYSLARTGRLRCLRVGDLYRFRPEDISEYEATVCQDPNPAHQSTNASGGWGVVASVTGLRSPTASPGKGVAVDGYQAARRTRARDAAKREKNAALGPGRA
jgi:excisionase family DNA binding protein